MKPRRRKTIVSIDGERSHDRSGTPLHRPLFVVSLLMILVAMFAATASAGSGSVDTAGPWNAAASPTPTPTGEPGNAGECGHGYRKQGETPYGGPLCTHGPDELPLPWGDSYPGHFANDDPDVTSVINHCAGDGASAERVHWFYVYAAGTPNNIASGVYTKGQFRDKIGIAEAYLSLSDANHDQKFRNLCWNDKYVVIEEIQCPDQNDPAKVLLTVKQCLDADGKNSLDRIYPAFIDGYEEWDQQGLSGEAYRGGGADDSPTPDGRAPVYGVINTWTGFNILHELGHMLGSVFDSAPHSTAPYSANGGHCYDEWDVMCYDDDDADNEDPIVYVCIDNDDYWRFDCGHNKENHDHPETTEIDGAEDYWDPRGGSRYLANHWNTAASYFLTNVGLR